jgi:hypothetical protein
MSQCTALQTVQQGCTLSTGNCCSLCATLAAQCYPAVGYLRVPRITVLRYRIMLTDHNKRFVGATVHLVNKCIVTLCFYRLKACWHCATVSICCCFYRDLKVSSTATVTLHISLEPVTVTTIQNGYMNVDSYKRGVTCHPVHALLLLVPAVVSLSSDYYYYFYLCQ